MTIRNRLTSLFLAIVMSVLVTAPAFSADNSAVNAKIAALEQTYDISIRYEIDGSGTACIGTGALATLEYMLSLITPEVVRAVSAYNYSRTGRKLTYSFTYDYNSGVELSAGQAVLGSYGANSGIIELYLPSGDYRTYSSGESPLTMVHEFGHVLHLLLEELYGTANLEAEWYSLNGGIPYKGALGDGSYIDTVFFSEYAATEYGEDFAETFAHCVVRNRAGLGFGYLLNQNGAKTNLGYKVDYMLALLAHCIPNSATLVASMAYNANNTPIYAQFQGRELYGVKLQYVGLPSPNGVLSFIMNGIGEGVVAYQWLYEVGGWYTQGTSGALYLIFPGGYAQRLNTPLQLAA